MSQQTLIIILVVCWLVFAAAVFVTLLFVDAPYGRHVRKGWGPTLPNRLGWLFMEAPASLVFAVWFAVGTHRGVTELVFLAMWESHYLYRAFLYPFTLREDGGRMPLSVTGMAIVFNTLNATLNAWWLFTASGGYPAKWLADPRFVLGLILFVAGMAVARHSDAILRALRAPQRAARYSIPEGGLFRWVSCPNYLGELVEWGGWALATWSLPGLAFAVWTAANLVPRARANHRWYREHFADYPRERKALIPGLW